MVEHLLLDVEQLELALAAEVVADGQAVVAGAGPDLEDALPRMGVEQADQAIAGDAGVRRLHPEALPVGTGRRVVAPPPGGAERAGSGNQSYRTTSTHLVKPFKRPFLEAGETDLVLG